MNPWIKMGSIVLVAFVIIMVLAYVGSTNVYSDWLGLGSSTETTITTKGTDVTTSVKEQGAKTVWDWTQLLLVPVVLTVGGYLLNLSAQTRATQQAQDQRAKDKEQEERALRRGLLQKIYLDLIQEYNSTKRVRRLLRATARRVSIDSSDEIMIASYDRQMQILIDVQLRFETFIDQIESNPTLFSTQIDPLKVKLKSVEGYVNDIISEYEKLYKINTDANSQSILIDKLPKLKEFIGKYGCADLFRSNFIHPANEVMRIFLDILNSPELKG